MFFFPVDLQNKIKTEISVDYNVNSLIKYIIALLSTLLNTFFFVADSSLAVKVKREPLNH